MGIIIDDDGVMHKVFTKADVVAMLTELQSEIEETEVDVDYAQLYYCKIIQQKINSLKADQEGEE